MASEESRRIRQKLIRDSVPPGASILEERAAWEAQAAQLELPAGATWHCEQIAHVPCVWVRSGSSAGGRVILYLHGGGLIAGSPLTHRELAVRLSQRTDTPVLLVDFRLAPEHPFPEGLEDVTAVYLTLLRRGITPARVILGGDSSGAGLALSLLERLRMEHKPMPGGAFFISGHFDLTLSGESMKTLDSIDPLTSRDVLERAGQWYAGGSDLEAPLLSPLFADLVGLPPLLLQVGSHEILLSDSTRLAEKVAARGGSARLRVYDEMWHAWPMFTGLPEGEEALAEIGAFLSEVA
jgi:epsilon-lactone hydrolase